MNCDSRKYDTVKHVKKEYLEIGSQATYLINDKTMFRKYIKEKEIT